MILTAWVQHTCMQALQIFTGRFQMRNSRRIPVVTLMFSRRTLVTSVVS